MRRKTLLRGWKLSFELNPVGEVGGYSSIIHATINGNRGHGQRIPAVWFLSNTRKLHIVSGVGANYNYIYNTKFNLPRNRFSTIVIQQIQKNDLSYHFQIIINGRLIHSVLNSRPKVFHNVKYYGSSPWYKPAKAMIRNVNLEQYKHRGMCKFETELKLMLDQNMIFNDYFTVNNH